MFKQKPLAAAVSMALWSLTALPAMAQTTSAEAPVQTVEVTGIRASMAKSLSVKKNATANVEVITAEDVGKMPDKNLADSLQRLAGVAVRTDYDEAEKVSMRGTNPDMSLILFNGHTVSGGDWYVADQGSSSRSTSLSLMPSSVLNQALVYKTSQANIVDGGLAGTINVTTRKPLSQKERLSGLVSVGASHAELPGKTAPDLNASVTWKNEANTFGVIAQGFAEKRFVRRDSVSRFAYGTSSGWGEINTATMLGITDASLAGTGYKAADLNGVRLPGSMSSEFVESVRDRKGGMVSMQYKPNQDLDVTMTGFHSQMNANNNGRLTSGAIYSMLLGKNEPLGATAAASQNTFSNGQRVYAQIRNPVIVTERTIYGHDLKVLKAADIVYPNGTVPQYIGNSEGFYRDGAQATSSFLDLDAKYRVSQDLTVKGLFSATRGVGKTDLDQGTTFARYGTGVSYALGSLHDAPYVKYQGAGENRPGINPDGSGYMIVGRTASGIKTTDKEFSGQFDAEYKLNGGFVQSIESGLRHADHKRFSGRFGPAFRTPLTYSFNPTTGAIVQPTPTPTEGWQPYPSDFGDGLDGGYWDNTGFTYSPEALKAYIAANTKPTTAAFERRVSSEIDMRERQSSAYIMANLEHDRWSGNVGVRYVRTVVDAQIATPIPNPRTCQRTEPGKTPVPCAAYPGAIVDAGDAVAYYDNTAFNPLSGTMYYKTPTHKIFKNVLPSLNLRYEITKDMIARFGASRTIGRQNYNVLGSGFGTPGCDASGCKVTGPNPDLKPLTSDNVDLSWGWYFAPRSAVTVSAFHSKIDGYVKTGTVGTSTIELTDPRDQVVKTFFINTSSQQGAKITGLELSYEQPFGSSPFGFTSNVSRAKTKVDDGRPMVGASEWAGNLGVYFENDLLSARLVSNYRGEYVNSSTAPSPTANSQGLSVINGVTMPTAPTMAAPVTTLAFNVSYNIMKNLQLTFDATNLTNVKRAYYRYSEEEQQKLDVSGRQFYLNLKYKF
ncbi:MULTISPECIES: TonB-dependent receptor [unclassified Massilia]|uniref:TonB-dependent receptor n=1 Tax=unclassified Massilia TaxID=2609279 RepID=UPI00177EC2E0|nr:MULTISPECIES: TonB-dependent receptor [unclassified Massilia]MBD8531155.1 TonB-dependent receptor [Massilia sp. CFBP 13647]MBD8674991.1 TonB-dependent receptor [Massilia sp. CFBP 13721]